MMPFGMGVWNIVIFIIIAFIILACIIGAVFLIVWAVRRTGAGSPAAPTSGPAGNPNAALQIAQERYARGEINRDEYQQIVDDLRK